MDRDEGCIRDEVTIGCEERAREIESLLDVGADGRLLERSSHRFCNTHEAIGKQRQENGIGSALARHVYSEREWRRASASEPPSASDLVG